MYRSAEATDMSLLFPVCTRGANYTPAEARHHNISLFSSFIGILLSDILQSAMRCLQNQCLTSASYLSLDLVYDGMLPHCSELLPPGLQLSAAMTTGPLPNSLVVPNLSSFRVQYKYLHCFSYLPASLQASNHLLHSTPT